MVPSAPTNRNTQRPSPISAKLFRCKRTHGGGGRELRRQVKTVDGCDADHGGEQADLEQHQPPVIGGDEVARAGQQVPTVDAPVASRVPTRGDAERGKAAGRSGGGARAMSPLAGPDAAAASAPAAPPIQAPAATRCRISDGKLGVRRARRWRRHGRSRRASRSARRLRQAAARRVAGHRISAPSNSASASRAIHTSPKRVSVSTDQAPPCRQTLSSEAP